MKLSKGAQSRHWRIWKATADHLRDVAGYDADEVKAARYDLYEAACRKTSLKDLSNDDLDAFEIECGIVRGLHRPDERQALLEAARCRKLVYSLQRYDEPLVAKLARDKFKSVNWRGLNSRQLWQLMLTVKSRKAVQAREG